MSLFEFMIFLGIALVPTVALAWLIARFKPHWPAWKGVILSSFPVPGLVMIACLVLFVDAAMTSEDRCGLDACAMAMLGAIFILFYALAVFAIGLMVGWFVLRSCRPRGLKGVSDRVDDIFQ